MRFSKPGSCVELRLLQHLAREQRDQPDQRTHAERRAAAAVDMQLVVVEAVVLVPQPRAAERVHRVGDRDEVLEELGRDVLVRRVLAAPARAPWRASSSQ